jgi:taurine dioxygenase
MTSARTLGSAARTATRGSIEVEPLTCTIGAELRGVSLADAARDGALFAEIDALLLKHRVLFLRDQDITRADHVAFARRFGELEPRTSSTSTRRTTCVSGRISRRGRATF